MKELWTLIAVVVFGKIITDSLPNLSIKSLYKYSINIAKFSLALSALLWLLIKWKFQKPNGDEFERIMLLLILIVLVAATFYYLTGRLKSKRVVEA